MCGIFGFATLGNEFLNPSKVRDVMRFLAFENRSRGRDSTGLGIINNQGDIILARQAKPVEEWIKEEAIISKISERFNRETRIVLGHTRQGTTGKVCLLNAQPFRYGSVIGTHNGIISNYQELFSKYKLDAKTECDSEVIFALMSLTQDLKKKGQYLEELSGYFAITFHDIKEPGTMYFSRSSAPLAIYKGKGFLLWSSEEEHVLKAMAIFGIRAQKIKLRENSLLRINANGKQRIRLNCKSWSTSRTDGYFNSWVPEDEWEYNWPRKTVRKECQDCKVWKADVFDRKEWIDGIAGDYCYECWRMKTIKK